ncbi:MAG: LacI family DNA-binding transcriptional regulator [Bacillota bacterium]|nr:LacI family DNA-binding transcriptional regulator [Bacillota bacterium]
MATLKDVAAIAEVSVSTASRALSGKPGVSERVRARVLAASEQVGYCVQQVPLRRGSEHEGLLAITSDHLANPFCNEVVRAIENYCLARGYNAVSWNMQGLWRDVHAFARAIQRHKISGLLCVSVNLPGPIEKFILDLGLPCVTVGRYVQSRRIDSVTADNFNGALDATKHLVSLGHQRIVLLTGPEDSSATIDRTRGYREVLASRGLLDERLIRRGSLDYQSGHDLTLSLLQQGLDFTAIFAASDIMAVGVIEALAEKGLRVPEDVAVVGFDNIELAGYSRIQLTTVDHPKMELGEAAAERIVKLIEGPSTPLQHVVLPVRLVVRRTCGAQLAHGEALGLPVGAA